MEKFDSLGLSHSPARSLGVFPFQTVAFAPVACVCDGDSEGAFNGVVARGDNAS